MLSKESVIETAKSFINDCAASGLSFKKVMLFGSAVNGQMHEGSDIDLLLVSDMFNDNPFDNLKLYSKINIRYPQIETHAYSTKNYSGGNDFINEISKQSIVLV